MKAFVISQHFSTLPIGDGRCESPDPHVQLAEVVIETIRVFPSAVHPNSPKLMFSNVITHGIQIMRREELSTAPAALAATGPLSPTIPYLDRLLQTERDYTTTKRSSMSKRSLGGCFPTSLSV